MILLDIQVFMSLYKKVNMIKKFKTCKYFQKTKINVFQKTKINVVFLNTIQYNERSEKSDWHILIVCQEALIVGK